MSSLKKEKAGWSQVTPREAYSRGNEGAYRGNRMGHITQIVNTESWHLPWVHNSFPHSLRLLVDALHTQAGRDLQINWIQHGILARRINNKLGLVQLQKVVYRVEQG